MRIVKKAFSFILIMSLCVSALSAGIITTNAATNSLATEAINTLQKKSGFQLNQPSGGLTCYQFAAKVFKALFKKEMGSQNSDYRSITTTTMNLVGSYKGVTSQAKIKELLLKAYPGDIIQYKSSATWCHAAVIKSVNSNGITLYHATTEKKGNNTTGKYYVWEQYVSWGSAGTYYIGSFTTSSHGISLYHSKDYNSVFGTPTYNIAYNANGGTGTMASRTIKSGETFTPSKCTFTKSGYYFAGYNVMRKSDSKWFVSGKGWFVNSNITNAGYTKAVYNNGTNYVFSGSWVNGVNPGETYTFYPIWKPNNTKLWFYPNYSGCNYIMGGGLDSRMSNYINSRDTSIYTLSVDSTQRLNNQNSIKITATSSGSSDHDMKIATSTNQGHSVGVTGDNRKLTLTFWAKASVSGAKMYFRWGYNSDYKSVSLTTEWKKYSVDMTKNIYSGGAIHPYIDKAGTFWVNNLTLCDDSNGTNNCRYEDGYNVSNQVYSHGNTYSSLPTPVRDGYKFLGWYTQL